MITKNIKNKLSIFCVGCGFVAALTACSDVLETSSNLVEYEKNNQLNQPVDSFYSVMGIVNKMQIIADRTMLLGEIRSDLVSPTDAASSDLKNLANFDLSEANKYNQVADYYAVINNCNYFLAHVDTAMQRRGRKLFLNEFAAVKGFRAWTYLELIKAYGNVPFITEPLMTERAADEAMHKAPSSIEDICQYFINDITPYADAVMPDYGEVGGHQSSKFFIPMKALLGDLCLWSGRYLEAARWYNAYLNDKKNPIQFQPSRSRWTNVSNFNSPSRGYSIDNSELLSFIPMEEGIFYGTISDIKNVYSSTYENNYFYQMEPSRALRDLSKSQVNCVKYMAESATTVDTVIVDPSLIDDEIKVGDLRLYSLYSMSTSGTQDKYSEYSSKRQTISKFFDNRIATYRRAMVYLRYAEALNRAGFPQSAMTILKYGICPDNISIYVDSLEQVAASDYIQFDPNIFTRERAMGVHSNGSGDSDINPFYVLPQPEDSLATRQDTINYQIPLVEDLIVNEMALEGMFEGYRFYDLMRVALRRGDASYLANPVSRRNGVVDERLRALLMDKKNWYLPLP